MIPLGVLASSYVAPAGGGHSLTDRILSDTNATTYTFSGVDLGAASTNRTIVVIATAGQASSATFSGITLDTGGGATAMTLDANAGGNSQSYSSLAVARLSAPTGNTGTVVVTCGSAAARAAIMVYQISSAITVADTDIYNGLVGTGELTTSATTGALIIAGGYGIEATAPEFTTGVTVDHTVTKHPEANGWPLAGSAVAESTGDITVTCTLVRSMAVVAYTLT